MKLHLSIALFVTVMGMMSVGEAQPAFLTNGLVAYYPFNQNLTDATGHLHNGVSNGTGLSFTADRYGSNNAAAHFAGGGYVSITPTPFNVNADYTISFWIKLDNTGNSVDNFFSTLEDNQGGMNVRIIRNTPLGWAFVPKGQEGIDSIPPTNYFVWHAFVCVRQGTNDFMYIDSQLMASGNFSGITTDSGSLWIGRHQSSATYDLHGAIDDIRFYNRALSGSEAAQLYAFDTAGLARGATATATLTSVFVTGVTVTDGGFGYTNTPLVRIISSDNGSGAQAFAVVSNGMVTAVTVTNAGVGYSNVPSVIIEPPFIPSPTLGIQPMSYLTFSNLTTGSNYQLQSFHLNVWVNDALSFTAAGSNFAQFFPGFLDSTDYRLALEPAPSQAFATPQIVNGFVVGAMITNGGAGYVSVPPVTIVDAVGSNAVASAQIGGGMVTNIAIMNAGFGYSSNTMLHIAPPPPGTGISPSVQAAMRIDASRLSPYDNYQVQFKQDLNGAWSNYGGGMFTPTNATNSQFLFITNGTGFFRLQYVP